MSEECWKQYYQLVIHKIKQSLLSKDWHLMQGLAYFDIKLHKYHCNAALSAWVIQAYNFYL